MAVFALFVPILIGRPDVSRRYVVSVSLSILTDARGFRFADLPSGPWATEEFCRIEGSGLCWPIPDGRQGRATPAEWKNKATS